jgi:hypothetical protein
VATVLRFERQVSYPFINSLLKTIILGVDYFSVATCKVNGSGTEILIKGNLHIHFILTTTN